MEETEVDLTIQTEQFESEIPKENDVVTSSESMDAIETTYPSVDSKSNCAENGNDSITSEDACLFRLEFRDEATFNELQQILTKCLRDTLFGLKKSLNVVADESQKIVQFFQIQSNNENSIFMVDTIPSMDTGDNERIPEYESTAIDLLNDMVDTEPKHNESNNDAKMKMGTCWNCNGNHTLRDCKELRDPEAINRAKQLFTQKTKTERYHLEVDQKYTHLVPGVISHNLREALGLRSRELPSFFYMMRKLSYPSAWLEEAKISHSGISLITNEDGANGSDEKTGGIEYDPSKFIEFPGFNAPLPSHILDETDYYGVPQMRFEDSIDGLTQRFQDNLIKSYKRKRQKRDIEGNPDENVKCDDMDIASNDEESPISPPVEFSHPKLPLDDNGNSNTISENFLETSCDSNRLSLTELQRKQEEILAALADADHFDNPETNSSPASPDELKDQGKNGTTTTTTTTTMTTIEMTEVNEMTIIPVEDLNETVPTENENVLEPSCSTPSTPQGYSKSALSGTPIIKQFSPFSSLPCGEKWSVGVTDVIDFENLPEATGTYQKLSDVLRRVRTFVQESNEEHDDEL